MQWLGLDIGGANLKACDGKQALSLPFELWKSPGELAQRLELLRNSFPETAGLAVTMTGELCDCFATRAEGVRQIVGQTVAAFADCPIRFYQVGGQWVEANQATREWLKTAASNWHALATAVTRFLPDQRGTLVDMGSTTTDIIPLEQGEVAAVGETDFGRLSNDELVYTGVWRSPVCAVARSISLFDREVLLAQEWFATMGDVYTVLGRLPEQPHELGTADGRPADGPHAMARLARCVCSDPEEIGEEAVRQIAEQIAFVQAQTLRRAIKRVCERGETGTAATAQAGARHAFVVSGSGEWLAAEVIQKSIPGARIGRLSDVLGKAISDSAAAWAVFLLASEQMPDGNRRI